MESKNIGINRIPTVYNMYRCICNLVIIWGFLSVLLYRNRPKKPPWQKHNNNASVHQLLQVTLLGAMPYSGLTSNPHMADLL